MGLGEELYRVRPENVKSHSGRPFHPDPEGVPLEERFPGAPPRKRPPAREGAGERLCRGGAGAHEPWHPSADLMLLGPCPPLSVERCAE